MIPAAAGRTRRYTFLAALLVLTLAGVPAADAHMRLERSSPKSGATVKKLPNWVTLRFSVAPKKVTRMRLTDSRGRNHVRTVRRGSRPQIIRVRTKNPRRGVFTLRWRVLGVDGHAQRGTVRFRVR